MSISLKSNLLQRNLEQIKQLSLLETLIREVLEIQYLPKLYGQKIIPEDVLSVLYLWFQPLKTCNNNWKKNHAGSVKQLFNHFSLISSFCNQNLILINKNMTHNYDGWGNRMQKKKELRGSKDGWGDTYSKVIK